MVEFKKEALVLFEDMMARSDNEKCSLLYNVHVQMEGKSHAGGPPWLKLRGRRMRVR